jgi:DNA-directed RNA polymerase specialized sigma24 family protein
MPEAYSLILLWRYWEQRSTQEIAAQTGRTEKAVERMLARAREQFKRRWANE